MEPINLELLPKDGEAIMKALEKGNMVVARSKADFLYVLDFEGEYHMFNHTPGAPGGGQKRFPKDEKHHAIVRKLPALSESLYVVEFQKEMNIYSVMASAEDGILSMFPGSDSDADGEIEFIVPSEGKSLRKNKPGTNY